MNLNTLIKELQELQAQGHGNKQVYYRVGSSGDCGLLGSSMVTDHIDNECGPFDLEDGEEYIRVYAGN